MVSYSEACAYLDCPKKWQLMYENKIKKSSIHMDFGVMAHKVLETREIPDETLYPELKEAFNIDSWSNYFKNVFVELDKILDNYEILDRELKIKINDISVVIDLVCKHKDTKKIFLMDYKFTATPKDYLDLYLDAQLKLYAYAYAEKNWLNVDDISVGYISIPKQELKEPAELKNGKLSKNKTQCTTKSLFLKAIQDRNLDVAEYLDILDSLPEYIHSIFTTVSKVQVDKTVETVKKIDKAIQEHIVFENISSKKCKNCDYVKECKYDNY